MSESLYQKHKPDHRYTVELRFYGDTLEPSEISERLNLQPSSSCQGIGPGGRKRRPYWGYDGHDEEDYQYDWFSLEEGLEFVLRRLHPLQATIIELSQRFDAVWWCGHFQSSFYGGPTLSPKLLAELASYGVELNIDTYYHDPADDFDESASDA